MSIQFTFPDNLNAQQVANQLAYWATVLTQGYKVVVAAVLEAEKATAATAATDIDPNGPANDNVIDLAKAARTREAKKAKSSNGKVAGAKVETAAKPKTDDKLTEARVRSVMIDYVNAAAPALKAARKEVFHSLLNEFGVQKVVDLTEDKYQAMIDLVETRTVELEKMREGE